VNRPYRDRRAAAYAHFGPNMTPMVDVVMVILIFFMVSASLMGPEWLLRVALPRPRAAVASQEVVPVSVALWMREGATMVRMSVGAGTEAIEFPASELARRIGEVASERGASRLAVALSAQDEVTYEDVVRAHERCVVGGVSRIALPPSK